MYDPSYRWTLDHKVGSSLMEKKFEKDVIQNMIRRFCSFAVKKMIF